MAGRPKSLYKKGELTEAQLEIRDLAMSDLGYFVGLLAKHLLIGHCHMDLLRFFMRTDEERQLVIWPRGHLKSTLLAYYAAWHIVNNPETTVVYLSATLDLAEKQTGLVKMILESTIVRKYWPELLPDIEGKRDLWRTTEFNVGHWKRKEEVVRDPTFKAAGINGNIVGFHGDLVCLDDLVTGDNTETKTQREEVNGKYSYISSVLNAGGMIKAVGTRYHPDDLYDQLINMVIDIEDDDTGELIEQIPAYTVTQEVVEIDGEFLWPRSRRGDGKWFGFNRSELAKKRADYIVKSQFFAQYYNDPSDPENKRITAFEYYDRGQLHEKNGKWYAYTGQGVDNPNSLPLNVYAAIDFASTLEKRSDYTAIVVIGVDRNHNIYVLDIARFKTDKISVMQEELTRMYDKWHWLKLRAEATSAQNLVVEQIKMDNRKIGRFYTVDKVKPTTNKQLRIMSTLEPRYAQSSIFHYRGGNCQVLEDELISTKPPHDDVSDTLASVIEIIQAPTSMRQGKKVSNIKTHPRFGGMV